MNKKSRCVMNEKRPADPEPFCGRIERAGTAETFQRKESNTYSETAVSAKLKWCCHNEARHETH